MYKVTMGTFSYLGLIDQGCPITPQCSTSHVQGVDLIKRVPAFCMYIFPLTWILISKHCSHYVQLCLTYSILMLSQVFLHPQRMQEFLSVALLWFFAGQNGTIFPCFSQHAIRVWSSYDIFCRPRVKRQIGCWTFFHRHTGGIYRTLDGYHWTKVPFSQVSGLPQF